jgi:hypothetical protein
MFRTHFHIFSVILLGAFWTNCIVAQTPISGIVNSYSAVTAIQTNQNSVIVQNASAFSAGDRVLLIQMQGATIDQSQTSMFGTVTNYGNAGNYEFQDICAIQGNKITFTHSLVNTYSLNALQLIRVPVYQSAVISGADITAQPWNGTTGGVVVIEAETLDLGTQNIDVSGLGFRGGDALMSGANCLFVSDPSYFTPLTDPDALAKKGEGISDFVTGKECGRGPQANGGGGGNNHNGGGSGGGNYSSGGAGGQRIKESAFLCGSVTGTSSFPLNTGYAQNKIFMGGGGGAGHGNNSGMNGESGLNGAGIVILKVGTLISNGSGILAHGEVSPTNANSDGAGGGGAGGSVIMDIQNYQGIVSVDVSGSDGISTNNNGTSNCTGPGGGGSGGVVWVSGSTVSSQVSVNFSGGQAGVIATTSQSNCTVGSTNGAQNGSDGVILIQAVLHKGTDIFSFATVSENACNRYFSPSGLFVWDSSGTYYDTLQNSVGCDSVVEINLTITQVDTTVYQSSVELISAVIGAQYQWLDCDKNYAIIPGETNQSFTATANGSYALEITIDGCTDTSSCHQVVGTSVFQPFAEFPVRVFPNPTQGEIFVQFGQLISQTTLSVYTITGAKVMEKFVRNTDQISLFLPPEKGLYFLHIEDENGQYAIVKIVRL